MLKQNHNHFMLEALALSKKALPECRPNPPVACLLVHHTCAKSEVLAQGFTQAIGGDHAEVQAIIAFNNKCQIPLEQMTAYVTLEPCAFEGRTPSCAKMLAASGIRQVIVAMLDPDPRNAGKGVQLLEEAGVNIELGIAEKEVSNFLGPYLGQS